MNRADSADIIWVLLCMILVGSALLQRRWSMRGAVSMVVNWVLIFGVALVLFSYRGEIAMMFDHTKAELGGDSGQQVAGGTVSVPMSPDGHFWVEGRVNGIQTRFLVDSGASITALSERTAMTAGLDMNGLPVAMQTANGAIQARRTSIRRLDIGNIAAEDLSAVVAGGFGDVNVVGMNFLSRLKGWRVEGKTLILDAGAPGAMPSPVASGSQP